MDDTTKTMTDDGVMEGGTPDVDAAEEVFVSDEMKQIQADIAAQDALIEEARAARRELVKARRRQARLDEAERERRNREREQADALAFWRLVHDSRINRSDGRVTSAYEFITDDVMPRTFSESPAAESMDADSTSADARADTPEQVGGVDSAYMDEAL